MRNLFQAFERHARRKGEEGQTLAEYSLVFALIALVCVAALTAFSLSIENLYDIVSLATEAMINAVS